MKKYTKFFALALAATLWEGYLLLAQQEAYGVRLLTLPLDS